MNNIFFDGHDEQSLGKIVQRCRCENVVFVAVFFFLSVTLRTINATGFTALFAPSFGFWSVISSLLMH